MLGLRDEGFGYLVFPMLSQYLVCRFVLSKYWYLSNASVLYLDSFFARKKFFFFFESFQKRWDSNVNDGPGSTEIVPLHYAMKVESLK